MRHRVRVRGLLAAVCIAASVWTKQTSFMLIPVLAVGLPLIGWRHKVPVARIVRVTCVAVGAFVLLIAPLWVWSYQHYGSIVTTQDTLELAAKGDVLPALMKSFSNIPWSRVVTNLFVPGQPWVGGWSFLPIHETLASLHGWIWSIVLAAAVGSAVIALRRVPRIDSGLAVCAAVVVFTRDLRVHDNPALAAAVRDADAVVPLFVLDDRILGSRFAASNRLAFLTESLTDLDARLRERDAALVVRRGDWVDEVATIVDATGAHAVHVAADVLLVGYVALLVRQRNLATERQLKVRLLPTARRHEAQLEAEGSWVDGDSGWLGAEPVLLHRSAT